MLREESILRTSLLPGLLRAVAFNAAHRNGDVALFEIGPVFRRPPQDQELPDERERLTVVLSGREAPAAIHVLYALADALRIDGLSLTAATFDGLHPGRTARVDAGHEIGAVGEIDPRVLPAWDVDSRVAVLDLDVQHLLTAPRRPAEMRPVSRQPSNDIDLAFVVPDTVPAADVERALRSAGGDLLVALELFDVYRGAGVPDNARSLAYRLRFQAVDRTLSDADAGALREKCIAAVEKLGAQLRG
jgi:phenylalanyl-tRNA synthetase beta chain